MVKNVLLYFLVVVFCCGCATFPKDNKQKDTGQLRIVRTAIIVKGDSEGEAVRARKIVEDASNIIEKQVGIKFEVEVILKFSDPRLSSNLSKAMIQVIKVVENNGLTFGKEFDVAVGFSNYTIIDLATIFFIPMQRSAIDDIVCRCVIVTKSTNSVLLAHEFAHVFYLDDAHNHDFGLLNGFYLELVPGVPLIKLNSQLSEEAREIIMKYKYRQFPELPSEFKTREREELNRKAARMPALIISGGM